VSPDATRTPSSGGELRFALKHGGFETLDFLFDQSSDTMLREVDLGGIDAENFGGFLHAPTLQDVAVEDLILAW
jgi:hypothetical protein